MQAESGNRHRIAVTERGVQFAVAVNGRDVTALITHNALESLSPTLRGQPDRLEQFGKHRGWIEAAAMAKARAGMIEPDGSVVLTEKILGS